MHDLARLIESVDPRVIAALALAVSLLAYQRLIRRDRRDDARIHAELMERRREDARAARETAEKRAAFLEAFKELAFEPDPDSDRRFVWEWPASWTTAEIPDPRPMPLADAFFLQLAIWDLPADWRPLQVLLNTEAQRRGRDPNTRFIYLTDRERTYRSRLVYVSPSGLPAYLALAPRGSDTKPPFCLKHLRFFGTEINCGDCGVTVDEVQRRNATVLEDLRREWQRRPRAGGE